MHEVRGRVLQDSEVLDLINVADSDILLYEVRPLGSENSRNNGWTFYEREVKKKNVRKNSLNEEVLSEKQLMA